MSRIGKKAIQIPQGVKMKCENARILVEGPKGKLEQVLLDPISLEIKDNQAILARPNDQIRSKVNHGTMRSLVFNMITGVSEGFTKSLIIEGVGFKAAVQGKKMVLNLGFSHPIELNIPEGLAVKAKTPTEVTIEGINKQMVGFFAAKIRSYYEPEPYKGKGVRYSDEVIRRKAGKTVAK